MTLQSHCPNDLCIKLCVHKSFVQSDESDFEIFHNEVMLIAYNFYRYFMKHSCFHIRYIKLIFRWIDTMDGNHPSSAGRNARRRVIEARFFF